MKIYKFLLLFSVIMLGFGFTACSENGTVETESAQISAAAGEEAETTVQTRSNAMNKEKYDKLFSEQRIWNSEIITFSKLTVKEGRLVVLDPLFFFGVENVRPYTESVPAGEYDVKACIADFDSSKRIAAVTVPFTDKSPVNFAMALNGTEDPEEVANLKEGEYFGFPVDAGLAAIADMSALSAYSEFAGKWEKENDDNIYDGYLSELFEQSYKADPDHQREGGDFIDLTVPDTDMHIPMFATGWGDGVYPVYWGYSEDGSLCSVTVIFIDPDVEES